MLTQMGRASPPTRSEIDSRNSGFFSYQIERWPQNISSVVVGAVDATICVGKEEVALGSRSLMVSRFSQARPKRWGQRHESVRFLGF
jgi:hypothetical protein